MADPPPVVVHRDRLYERAPTELSAIEIAAAVKAIGGVEQAAAQLGISRAVAEASVRAASAPPQAAASPPEGRDALGTAKDLLALVTGVGALVLLLGGAVVAIRLRSAELPPEAVFAQLPRDYLFAVGTSQVLAPALVVVGLHALLRSLVLHGTGVDKAWLLRGAAGWAIALIGGLIVATGTIDGLGPSRDLDDSFVPIAAVVLAVAVLCAAAVRAKWSDAESGFRWRHGPPWLTLSLTYGLVAMLAATLICATFPLLEARACTKDFAKNGDLVAAGSDRIFLGEAVRPPRRLDSIPASEVEELFIGTNAGVAVCDPRGQGAPVVVHASSERVLAKLDTARERYGTLLRAATPEAARVAALDVATATRQAARSTQIGASAGGNMNDELVATHRDEAEEIGGLVIEARMGAGRALAAMARLTQTARYAGTGASAPRVRVLAAQAVARTEDLADAMRRLDRQTFATSPLLVPQPT